LSSFADSAADSIEGLVRESFSALIGELPEYYQAMCAPMAGKAVEMNIEGERFCICFEQQSARFIEAIPQLVVRTDRQTILDTLDGQTNVYNALLEDRLSVKGTLDDLVELQTGLIAYLNGALRSSAFPELLSRLRDMKPAATGEEIEA
jgi:hypothetical protein